jgi:hypothetical protein
MLRYVRRSDAEVKEGNASARLSMPVHSLALLSTTASLQQLSGADDYYSLLL